MQWKKTTDINVQIRIKEYRKIYTSNQETPVFLLEGAPVWFAWKIGLLAKELNSFEQFYKEVGNVFHGNARSKVVFRDHGDGKIRLEHQD